jgi:hypothetical protein
MVTQAGARSQTKEMPAAMICMFVAAQASHIWTGSDRLTI